MTDSGPNCRCVLVPDPVEAMRKERDDALAILSDFLDERGLSWLAKLAPLKEELRSMLFLAESSRDGACIACPASLSGVHVPECGLAPLLAIVDEKFLPGLIERAHAEALRIEADRQSPAGVDAAGRIVTRAQMAALPFDEQLRVQAQGRARLLLAPDELTQRAYDARFLSGAEWDRAVFGIEEYTAGYILRGVRSEEISTPVGTALTSAPAYGVAEVLMGPAPEMAHNPDDTTAVSAHYEHGRGVVIDAVVDLATGRDPRTEP